MLFANEIFYENSITNVLSRSRIKKNMPMKHNEAYFFITFDPGRYSKMGRKFSGMVKDR